VQFESSEHAQDRQHEKDTTMTQLFIVKKGATAFPLESSSAAPALQQLAALEKAKDALQRTSLHLAVAMDCAAKLYANTETRTDRFVAAWNATHPTQIIQRCRGARIASACLRYTTNATAVCDACGSRK
jgi:hypothetical protein